MPVSVRYGVNSINLDSLVGKTIREVRNSVEDVLNVPESAQVRVNGSQANEDSVIAEGSTVEFIRVAGEKGVSNCS